MYMKLVFTTIISLYFILGNAQVLADFEEFSLEENSFLNGSDLSGGYLSGGVFFYNSYDETYGSWGGWSISNVKNDTTAGFTNQFAAFPASGAEDTETYAVASAYGPSYIVPEEGESVTVQGMYITNSTYAALSMQQGDAFAKKFGGETGDDADFFLLTIKGYLDGTEVADSVDFYLADYRFEDNSMDYILEEWEFVDLSSLGVVDSVSFALSSSDVGAFGMNTPAYFCVDRLATVPNSSSAKDIHISQVSFYPNPAIDEIIIKNESLDQAMAVIYNVNGQVVQRSIVEYSRINVRSLANGQYFTIIQKGKEQFRFTFTK